MRFKVHLTNNNLINKIDQQDAYFLQSFNKIVSIIINSKMFSYKILFKKMRLLIQE